VVDVAIVGAGISGIGMAAHLGMRSPERSYLVLERRERLGGTWDLFRYPGVRSDSDMYTLGFNFAPWRGAKAISDGAEIRGYLERVVDEQGIRPRIRFGTRVVTANWDGDSARWALGLEGPRGERSSMSARFLVLGTGYYDYDRPHEVDFPGRKDFEGVILHPQFWPPEHDCARKRVVVIGSGATAATIVPAMARSAAQVTMLQRTPSWYFVLPSRDPLARFLSHVMPARWVSALMRRKNIWLQDTLFRRSRRHPEKVSRYLTRIARKALGDRYDAAAFTPPYGPWQQRMCLVPDADLFCAIRDGTACIVTGQIEHFDRTGICLTDGRHLDADVTVTATGLRLAVAGGIAVSVDGMPVDFSQRFYYKHCMFSGVPNLAVIFGYINASWTLRADLISDYVCRLLAQLRTTGMDYAVPRLPEGCDMAAEPLFDFSSGYIRRGQHLLPKNGPALPWRLDQNYVRDKPWLERSPIADGVLHFGRAAATSAVPVD
jgi:monooxygenase